MNKHLDRLKEIKPIILTVFFSILLGTGCEFKRSLPVAKEKLVQVLVDIHIAEGATQQITQPELKDSLVQIYYGQIFKIHSIDETAFYESMAMLRENPYLLSELYTAVLDTIDQRMGQD